jgi:hypothetical protein
VGFCTRIDFVLQTKPSAQNSDTRLLASFCRRHGSSTYRVWVRGCARQGLRQLYFSMPLLSWLLGPIFLTVVTALYLAFIYYLESVDEASALFMCHQVIRQGLYAPASHPGLSARYAEPICASLCA